MSRIGKLPVALPKGVLAPGGRYTWQVRCPAATGVSLRADASFVTLSKEQAEARAALQAAALADASLLALLAEIDQGLGLLREAREEFRAASARDPGNAALAEALARLDLWMDGPPR
jgi:predicted Zn-dependent protease